MNFPRVEKVRRAGQAALVATIIGASMLCGCALAQCQYDRAIVELLVAAGAGGYVPVM